MADEIHETTSNMLHIIKRRTLIGISAIMHAADPKNAKSQATGEVTRVHEKPRKGDLDHKTYTIENDNTGKETTYGKRSITEKLDE
ncbi:uncharacterized protein FOMMEDRAFT_150825 [Fomitiporia mediterranea MF3/22]|uniref:uncharacterized protein n=1 Tax=Fomitiporia mediterranea (strain MF3/22) TaxID=694068 RepID=UPI0004407BE2|nr:uncharacterized protein FOMMEDRAFT_150825 [Fomitiporia mediterranea MF3/22]EJD08132.1 hypothetical protein FOMMEDRAFT_150825 [Fomitiporia mediterranea MF3/22]